MYIDAHTHITGQEFPEELAIARKDLEKILLTSTSIEEYQKALTYQDQMVDLAYGIFPDEWKQTDEKALAELEEVLKQKKITALGEIGLDYHWYPDNKEVQKQMFASQIRLADKYGLPIVIHSREATADTFEVVKNTPNRRKGMLHCFSGSLEVAREYTKIGYYISLGGVLTFKNAKEPKRVLQGIDLNYLLFETDAPYLTPVPNRGKPNKTYYVKDVYAFAAELLEMDIEELKDLVRRNYYRLFHGKD
jgi:TatD DNase family protein